MSCTLAFPRMLPVVRQIGEPLPDYRESREKVSCSADYRKGEGTDSLSILLNEEVAVHIRCKSDARVNTV